MKEIAISTSLVLDTDPAAAWAVVADYRRDPEWRTGVISMDPSPPGLVQHGTTTVETMKFAGTTYRNEGVVTAVAPGRSFRWRTSSGADADGARSVEPLPGGGCRVTLELRVRPSGLERVLAPVLGRMLARNTARDLARLQTLVAEGSPAPASVTAAAAAR